MILEKNRAHAILGHADENYTLIKEFKGKDLVGVKYEPPLGTLL